MPQYFTGANTSSKFQMAWRQPMKLRWYLWHWCVDNEHVIIAEIQYGRSIWARLTRMKQWRFDGINGVMRRHHRCATLVSALISKRFQSSLDVLSKQKASYFGDQYYIFTINKHGVSRAYRFDTTWNSPAHCITWRIRASMGRRPSMTR